jgi:replicative DNA helicase
MKNNEIINVPPQAVDLEEIVLGAIMLEREAYHEISSLISENSFYDERNQKVYKAIKSLFSASHPVDILTVTTEMRKHGTLESVGGPFYVTNLTSRVASGANIEYHAGIIQQRFLERETLRLTNDIAKAIYDQSFDIFDLQDTLVSSIQKLTESSAGQIAPLNDVIAKRMVHYETKSENGLTGVPTGFNSINFLTSGWQASNLTILAARPGMGKTALMLNFARNAAVIGKMSVAIFSLEMSKEQLTDRIISAETGIHLERLMNRSLEPYHYHQIHHSIGRLLDSQILIDDTASLSIQAFRSKCARLKRNNQVGMIVVDYLQLMKGESEYKNNREQEISSISRGLKSVAKDLNVPIIALSQLSRKVEERAGSLKRPMLSDLRESGSIEQDADQVVFLFRPEYYGMTEDTEGRSLAGVAEVIFAKNRNGSLDTIPLRFNGSIMKFSELEDAYFSNQDSNEPTF